MDEFHHQGPGKKLSRMGVAREHEVEARLRRRRSELGVVGEKNLKELGSGIRRPGRVRPVVFSVDPGGGIGDSPQEEMLLSHELVFQDF